MISLDSDILRGITSAANTAVDEITTGVERLNSVTTHDDWNCAERDMINEQILEARKNIKALYERTQSYLDALRRTADKFDAVDFSITRAFQAVQDNLSSALGITTPFTPQTGSSHQELKEALVSSKKLEAKYYGKLNNIDKPISICRYSDVDFSKLSGGVG